MNKEIIPIERIAQRIRRFRGEKVLLDFDLAALYRVTTGQLNRAVKQGIAMLSTVLNSERAGERTACPICNA